MKTIKNLLFVAFAAMTIAACQKEFENPQGGVQNIGKIVDFTGSMDDIQTKTTIWFENGLEEGVFPTRFLNADSVMVNGVSSGKTGKASGTVLSFSVQGVEAPYFAVSANQVAKEKDGYVKNYYDEGNHQYIITFADSQKYRLVSSKTNISFDSSADVFAAYSEDENLKFQHLSTFLVITVIGNENENASNANIRNIYVRQGDGSNIAGEWYVKYDENNVPFMEPKSLTDYITYSCVVKSSNEASNFSPDGVPQGKPMIIGVPSYDYENGLLVTIEDMDGNFSVFKIPAEKTKYADQGGTVFPFNPPFIPVVRETISSAEDWNSFATYVNATNGNGAKGTVTLTADITAENLKQITNFKGIFNGNDKTITQTAATSSLFGNLTGEIRDLKLGGKLSLTGDGAPFVTNLHAGAKITGCTNNMEITFDHNTHCYVTGIAAIAVRNDTKGLEVMEISNCTNNGKIEGTVDVSSANYNTAVAGIIGDVRASVGDVDYSLVLTNCKNTAPITLSPKSGSNNTYGMTACGVGGIIGYVRSAVSITLTDCDNSGDITVKADHIVSETGLKASPTAVGGIIGIGTGLTSSNTLGNYLPLTGIDYTLTGCDNSGTIYNCMVNASEGAHSSNKVYTGGLAGALVGTSGTFATITSCTNTGDVFSYDICGSDAATTSATSAVAGGFIGFGGNLDITGCTVDCQLGNGKRQSVAWGGVIGFAMCPFKLTNSTVNVVGYFNRISEFNMNRAVIAVVPVKYNTVAMDPAPSITASTISKTSVTCKMLTTKKYPLPEDTYDMSLSTQTDLTLTVSPFSSPDKVKVNLTNGKGATANSGVQIGEDNTYAVGTL